MPVNTLRMWLLGIIFTMLGSGINQFFSLRYPGVHIVALVAELLAFPIGVFLAKFLPISRLNPDRTFNIKEHALVTIMSNVSFGYSSADSTSIIQAAKLFYRFETPTGLSVMVVVCCQLLGYGVAGLAAPWIVRPSSIIWPGVLSNCALLSTLHSRANTVANGWKISRLRFFMIAMGCACVWYVEYYTLPIIFSGPGQQIYDAIIVLVVWQCLRRYLAICLTYSTAIANEYLGISFPASFLLLLAILRGFAGLLPKTSWSISSLAWSLVLRCFL